VTVSGQFRGRNLFGDLPRSPGNSRSDFVLRSSDAAIWVSGMAPKTKELALDPGSRVDTDRWLRISGIVRESKGLLWIEAKSVALAEREAGQTDAPAKAVVTPPAPAPEVLFSVPVAGETDVNGSAPVRIQLSRDLDLESLKGRVEVGYMVPAGAQGTPSAPPAFKLQFDERDRVLTVQFDQPLERFRTVRVALLDGIKGTDGQPLKPWQVTFTVAGR
jgi:hypothetical protein